MIRLLSITFVAATALAQDVPPVATAPTQTPLDQALQERLLNELWVSVSCRQQQIATVAAAQAEIAELKRQIDELKKQSSR